MATGARSDLEQFEDLKTRLKATWMTGDYDVFSRFMERGAEDLFRQLSISPGSRLLDVGCGAGQLALIAATAGLQVTGCDIATNWLARARDRAAAEGLNVTFEEGDAEALPYADAQFDVVVSVFGAMFAPRPDRVAAELKRVCRPGGMIAMANWTPAGFTGQMFRIISKHIAPFGMPSPLLWGNEPTVRDRFEEGIGYLKLERRFYQFEYPFSPAEVVDFYRANYGPISRAFRCLEGDEQKQLRGELIDLWSKHNRSDQNTTEVEAEYLELVATRTWTDVPAGERNSRRYNRSLPGQRSAALADRLEESAALLTAFAEGLSDEEWRTPVSDSDNRSVGVVVHHVATMYPIDIDVARRVASGEPVTSLTWEVGADFNAKHARNEARVTKSAAIELLRQNSRNAAEAVRAFRDDELDRAAPFPPSFGAPMTAQFVIEDRAVRHTWHHLARIRAALKR